MQVDETELYRQIGEIRSAVRDLDRSIRGDGNGEPGVMSRMRALEDWVKDQKALSRLVVYSLVGMALTGAGSLLLAVIRMTGQK